ncbi:MAG: fimbrillin family protein [Bacteroidales bacterium]|nr:fimbrillin family protein [Bacteroidales bacterium]
MKPVIVLLAAAAVLALAGCNKEAGRGGAGQITIEASVDDITKVSYDGAGTEFTAGDRIVVYGWLGSATEVPAKRVVDGVVNTLGTDGKWTPASQMLWKPLDEKHYFLGIFPERSVTSFTADEYELKPDDYTASDLLIATNLGGVTSSDGAVKLDFDHAMAKLVINLNFRSQWDATPAVSGVSVPARTKATVDYLTKTVTVTGTVSTVDIPAAASATAGNTLTFSGLMVPQDGVRRVVVTIDNKNYVYESATDIPLKSGEYTTLSLNVGRDRIDLGSVAIDNWDAGTALPDADAELVEDLLQVHNLRKFQHLCEVLLSKCDTNHDGILSKKEADAVTRLDISSQGIDHSLLGLWLFPNLTHLDCSSNNCSFLWLNFNTKLEYLDCRNNPELTTIKIAPGYVINEMYLPEPENPPIELTVNGGYTSVVESSKPITFKATVQPGLSAKKLVWIFGLNNPFTTAEDQVEGETYVLTIPKASDLGNTEDGKLYSVYVEMPDGSRSNTVRFGVFGKDPIIYFEKPFKDIGIKVDQRLLFSVFFYPGEGESGTPSIKTIGAGCNRSFNSGVKIQEDESIHWNKPGEKKVIVYFEKNGKVASDTLRVNVNTYTISFEEADYLPVY